MGQSSILMCCISYKATPKNDPFYPLFGPSNSDSFSWFYGHLGPFFKKFAKMSKKIPNYWKSLKSVQNRRNVLEITVNVLQILPQLFNTNLEFTIIHFFCSESPPTWKSQLLKCGGLWYKTYTFPWVKPYISLLYKGVM